MLFEHSLLGGEVDTMNFVLIMVFIPIECDIFLADIFIYLCLLSARLYGSKCWIDL